MDRKAMVATPRGQRCDEGAIAADDAGLRIPPAIHPFFSKRQGAGPLRVGRVVALDHPLNGMPQPTVLRTGETPSQEFGDGQIVLQFLQRLVELCPMRILRFLPRELPVLHRPLRTLDLQQRKPRLAQQPVRERSPAMDAFGSALRQLSEVGRRKRMDAPAASVSRLQYGHSLAPAAEFAGGHQPRGAGAVDDDAVWMWACHTGPLPIG